MSGVKLLRLVKRVSGHLLTLIVFEIPDETKDPRLMRLLQDQQYAAALEKQKGAGAGDDAASESNTADASGTAEVSKDVSDNVQSADYR